MQIVLYVKCSRGATKKSELMFGSGAESQRFIKDRSGLELELVARLITFFKAGVLGRYVIIIAHGLCSSGIFYIVNLYYERLGRQLLFLNKVYKYVLHP
ncbi:NADH-ubiquinone oxidoreductase chain 4 [Atta colombica]|uniref:NADH-ubiquinone oxidoreductase chain 4 n=1 Tax=Atta colombica TaxID=520822 RepID=A0A195BCF0_9HYME|nr:NADH-ubiquinone oxidoreductase chain 4 [Atta colombica]